MKFGYLCTMTFEELKLTRQFLNALEDAGFAEPTTIQCKAIPPIRAGQDLIGIAQTGTGKTAAFALPLLQVLKYAQGQVPRCLILAPTKELVLQIEERTKQFAKYTDLRVIGLYGGIGPKTQVALLEGGCDIIVATPGRFLEIYAKGAIHTKKIKHFVMDEADRMMDMGFMPQIRKIQEVIPQKRQNILFSATYPPRVEHLGDEFLLFPTRIEVTPQSTPVETVSQFLYAAPNFKTKLHLLMHLLRKDTALEKVIIFVREKQLAENIGRYLQRSEVGEVRIIHSNKGQNTRINAINDFREGDIRILVSTDVSARGIDIPAVSHVINFSVPRQYNDYVHRIGRTGRAFHAGIAITFFDPAEKYHVAQIESLIQQEIPRLDLPEEIVVEKTEPTERKLQLQEIDEQRKREDPTFQGAFHERKSVIARKLRQKNKKRW